MKENNAAFTLRKIREEDNPTVAKIVRDSLTEFGCNLPGTVYADPETDRIFQQYLEPGTVYYVAEADGRIVGGAGIGKVAGEPRVCELQKLYLVKEYRGKGIAHTLLARLEEFAREAGYKTIYLETISALKIAIPFYEKRGYTYLPAPLGNTGHFSCEIWMSKALA